MALGVVGGNTPKLCAARSPPCFSGHDACMVAKRVTGETLWQFSFLAFHCSARCGGGAANKRESDQRLLRLHPGSRYQQSSRPWGTYPAGINPANAYPESRSDFVGPGFSRGCGYSRGGRFIYVPVWRNRGGMCLLLQRDGAVTLFAGSRRAC